MTTWIQHVQRWKDCQRCPLGQQRGRICLARSCKADDPIGTYGGVLPCDVLFIGEAPGSNEDATGMPFVGPAGNLLDDIRQRALPPETTCAFTNLVACYPREAKATDNHQPDYGEILACQPRLVEFVNLAKPKLIVCVGGLAEKYVRHKDTIPCVDIVHPAYILSRLPAAQKGFEVNKCVVRVCRAYEDALAANKPYQEWGVNNAEVKGKKEQLRESYHDAGAFDYDPSLNYDWDRWKPKEYDEYTDDDIPF